MFLGVWWSPTEPLAFFSGISIWPSEMLRLIALLLAIHFMIKAHVDLRVNEHEVNERFFLVGRRPPKDGTGGIRVSASSAGRKNTQTGWAPTRHFPRKTRGLPIWCATSFGLALFGSARSS